MINRKNWEWVSTYEPMGDISRMKVPVLIMFGDQDHASPVTESIAKWEQALELGNNSDYKVKIFEGAGHGLIVGGHHAKGFPKYAQGRINTLSDWSIDHNIGRRVK